MGRMKDIDIAKRNGEGYTVAQRTKAEARAAQTRAGGAESAARRMANRKTMAADAGKTHNVGRTVPYPERPRATKASMRSKGVEAKSAAISSGRAPADLGPRSSAGAVRSTSIPAPASHPNSRAITAPQANLPRTDSKGRSTRIGQGDMTRAEGKAVVARTKRTMKKNLKANAPGMQAKAAPVARSPAGSVVGKVVKGATRVARGLASVNGPAMSIAESAQKQQVRERRRDAARAAGVPPDA